MNGSENSMKVYATVCLQYVLKSPTFGWDKGEEGGILETSSGV